MVNLETSACTSCFRETEAALAQYSRNIRRCMSLKEGPERRTEEVEPARRRERRRAGSGCVHVRRPRTGYAPPVTSLLTGGSGDADGCLIGAKRKMGGGGGLGGGSGD